MKTLDQNGNTVTRSIRKEDSGWGVWVWFGGAPGCGCATNMRRYFYDTRKNAQNGDISHNIGVSGRIA